MNKEGAINKAIRDNDSGYSSPIQIILSDIQMKIEDSVCEAVQSVGVNVDKDELIKALQYDREQYAKGFADGYAQGIEVGKNIVIEELKRCIENDFKRSIDVKFMVGEVDYDADEYCASCRNLHRDKGKWKCNLNNLERDIADPARRHCLGYEDVRKGAAE